MNYHSHEHRDEIWTVLSGEGVSVVDGEKRKVGPGDVIQISAGAKHMIHAFTALRIMEVQLGKEIRVSDKTKYDKPFDSFEM